MSAAVAVTISTPPQLHHNYRLNLRSGGTTHAQVEHALRILRRWAVGLIAGHIGIYDRDGAPSVFFSLGEEATTESHVQSSKT